MISTLRKQLTAFILLFSVFLVPLYSFAHDAVSESSKDVCACHFLLTDRGNDERGGQQDHFPGNTANDCCDSEECCPDAAEPPVIFDLSAHVSRKHRFHPHTNGYIPEVYPVIFVPPES